MITLEKPVHLFAVTIKRTL